MLIIGWARTYPKNYQRAGFVDGKHQTDGQSAYISAFFFYKMENAIKLDSIQVSRNFLVNAPTLDNDRRLF